MINQEPLDHFTDFSAGSLRRVLSEKCGVVGVVLGSETITEFGTISQTFGASTVRGGLRALAHRGVDSSGIASSESKMNLSVAVGSKRHILNLPDDALQEFSSNIVSGHTRYGTSGDKASLANAQPLAGAARISGIEVMFAVSHNGNLTNTLNLTHALSKEGIQVPGASDTVAIAKLVEALSSRNEYANELDLIKDVVAKLEGSFSIVFHFPECLVIARDSYSNRPLWLKTYKDSSFVASETIAFDSMEIPDNDEVTSLREIRGGEIVVLRPGKEPETWMPIVENQTQVSARCFLEFAYFERPDSIELGKHISEHREELGALLAREYDPEILARASYVTGVPNGGVPAARGFAREVGMHYIDLFEIDPEFMAAQQGMPRTFILPSKEERKETAERKHLLLLQVLKEIAGKVIIVIDDSLFRGNAFRRLEPHLKILESVGVVTELGLTYPPVKHPCYWGVSIPPDDELIANIYPDTKELAADLSVNSVTFLSADAIQGWANANGTEVCLHCSTGESSMPKPDEAKKVTLKVKA